MSRGKRIFDLFWTVTGLLVLSPLLAIVSLLIRVEDGGPVFFRQERVGHRGKRFRIWKFRTMVVDAEKNGMPLTVGRDARITRLGHWLRKLKIDELPQLFNVLSGDMSLVGPRPEVPQYVALYDSFQSQVLDLVPGITDPASLKYRQESDLLARASDPERTYVEQIMPEKIHLNLDYARHATVLTDFLVILRTLAALLAGRGGPWGGEARWFRNGMRGHNVFPGGRSTGGTGRSVSG